MPEPGERPETSPFEDESFEAFLTGDGGPLSDEPESEGPEAPGPKPPVGEMVGTGRRTRSSRAKRLARRAARDRSQRGLSPRQARHKAEIDLDVLEQGLSEAELPGAGSVDRPGGPAAPGRPDRDADYDEPSSGEARLHDADDESDADDLDDEDALADVEIVEEPDSGEPVAGSGARPAPERVAPAAVPGRSVPAAAPAPPRTAVTYPLPEPAPLDAPALDALMQAGTPGVGVRVLKVVGLLLLLLVVYAGGFLTRHFDLVPIGTDAAQPGPGPRPDTPGGNVPRVRGQITFLIPGDDVPKPDLGARIVLLPKKPVPDEDKKISWEGLATEPVGDADVGAQGASQVEALGGYVATADVEGTYVLGDLKPGDYLSLVISANAKRAPDQAIDDRDADLLTPYFQGVKLILGYRQYGLRPVHVRENEDITFDKQFGGPAPPAGG